MRELYGKFTQQVGAIEALCEEETAKAMSEAATKSRSEPIFMRAVVAKVQAQHLATVRTSARNLESPRQTLTRSRAASHLLGLMPPTASIR